MLGRLKKVMFNVELGKEQFCGLSNLHDGVSVFDACNI